MKLRALRAVVVPVLGLVVTSCVSPSGASNEPVPIAKDVYLTLPLRPDYPRRERFVQRVTGEYDEQRRTFESFLELSQDRVKIIVTVPSGPRLMAIDWSANGVKIERSAMVPGDLDGRSILADLFVAFWDIQAITSAFDGHATVVESHGVRRVYNHDREVIFIERSDDTSPIGRTVIVNHDFGYRLEIDTRHISGV